jgi:hypothetical protein
MIALIDSVVGSLIALIALFASVVLVFDPKRFYRWRYVNRYKNYLEDVSRSPAVLRSSRIAGIVGILISLMVLTKALRGLRLPWWQ